MADRGYLQRFVLFIRVDTRPAQFVVILAGRVYTASGNSDQISTLVAPGKKSECCSRSKCPRVAWFNFSDSECVMPLVLYEYLFNLGLFKVVNLSKELLGVAVRIWLATDAVD